MVSLRYLAFKGSAFVIKPVFQLSRGCFLFALRSFERIGFSKSTTFSSIPKRKFREVSKCAVSFRRSKESRRAVTFHSMAAFHWTGLSVLKDEFNKHDEVSRGLGYGNLRFKFLFCHGSLLGDFGSETCFQSNILHKHIVRIKWRRMINTAWSPHWKERQGIK